MLELYQFGPAWGLPDPSPFCIKLELWLKMAGIEYRSIADGDTRKAPKEKIPYIKIDGEVIGDSELIIANLKQRFGDAVDSDLTAEQQACSHLITRMMHDSFYWVLIHCRWFEGSGWKQVGPTLFANLPGPMKLLVPPIVRRSLKKSLHSQGLGRHSPEERMQFGCDDVDALVTLLGDKDFFMGDKPHEADATVQGFLISFIGPPIENPVKQYLISQPTLVDYYQRMNSRFYPDIPAPVAG